MGKASLVQREVAERSEVGGIALPICLNFQYD